MDSIKKPSEFFKRKLLALVIIINTALICTMPLHANETENASQTLIPKAQTLHTNLVLLALKADYFNRKCRGISINQNFNRVNRLFITKYSLTANNYIKTYINKDVRGEKLTLERAFKKELNQVGGCLAANQQNWRSKLNKEYQSLFSKAENSLWFPG